MTHCKDCRYYYYRPGHRMEGGQQHGGLCPMLTRMLAVANSHLDWRGYDLWVPDAFGCSMGKPKGMEAKNMIWFKPEYAKCLDALLPIVTVDDDQMRAEIRISPEGTLYSYWGFKGGGAAREDPGPNPETAMGTYQAGAVLERAAREWLEEREVYVVPDPYSLYVARYDSHSPHFRGAGWLAGWLAEGASYAEAQLEAMRKLLEGAK